MSPYEYTCVLCLRQQRHWHCVPCGLPQFTSGLFDSFDADTSNPYNILNTIPNQTHQPLARSTPVKPKSTKLNTTASLNKPTKE
ncbi:hypothetical protein BgiMline_001717, partial [Biomphalaria glabrata]